MSRTRKLKTIAPASIIALPETPAPRNVAPTSKIAQVISMLQRSDGATVMELVTMTGWLPHTTRAALTGLRKKGYILEKHSRDGLTAYAIAKGA
jgi:hypothetical protein